MTGCSYLKKDTVTKPTKRVVNTPVPTTTIIEEKRVILPENKRLKKVMREFDYVLFSRLNSEVEEGEEDMFFGKNTQKLLKDFIKESKKIPSLYPSPDKNYMILSKALTRSIIKLYKIVKVKKMDWVKPQIENIVNICNRCHILYGV
jgi:hypothetical protein